MKGGPENSFLEMEDVEVTCVPPGHAYGLRSATNYYFGTREQIDADRTFDLNAFEISIGVNYEVCDGQW